MCKLMSINYIKASTQLLETRVKQSHGTGSYAEANQGWQL